ncbi:hypothetical protein [uncultured Cohaesibacter sp.]|uniref:hypothetical protein n=1 Tax=uncultured Cohaesibacter sp. TaxID=1002546 RepID=UPI002AA687D0|nr:hypothetical protein [uncultured Cohaesibacter sp.]
MHTNSISHPRAITTIREPIHGAIDLTCFEREVVDSPYFQRLHFVLQNSTTYVAYPSNKNSRFVHSLGVCSVVGELFVSSLKNSPRDELIKFLKEAAEFIFKHSIESPSNDSKQDRNRKRLIAGWKETIYGHSNFSHRSFLKDASEPLCSDDESLKEPTFHGLERDFIIDTLWEACRLCGLIHDIGHLPMSHSFEMGLKRIDSLLEQYPLNQSVSNSTTVVNDDVIARDLVTAHHKLLNKFSKITDEELAEFLLNDIAVHERRGLMILEYIWKEDAYCCNGPNGDIDECNIGNYRDLIFSLTVLILYASSLDSAAIQAGSTSLSIDAPHFPAFLRVLKSIIAGEVDADRLDYTIRDGQACGSEIGTFDLKRVISNAVLRTDNDRFRIMYYERAISGLEHFFTQRHDGYKYLIYHRTSSRTESCLQELLGRLLHAAIIAPTSIVAKRLEEFDYIKISESQFVDKILPFSKETMASLDDANLRTMFMFLRKDLSGHINDEAYSGLPNFLIWPISCLLDILTVRDFNSLISPYKNHSFEKELKLLAKSDDFKEHKSMQDLMIEALESSSDRAFLLNLRVKFEEETSSKAILLVSYQKPKVYREESVSEPDKILVVEHSGDRELLINRSPLLKNMHGNLRRSSGVSMAIVSYNVKSDRARMDDLRNTLNKVLLEALKDYHHSCNEQ